MVFWFFFPVVKEQKCFKSEAAARERKTALHLPLQDGCSSCWLTMHSNAVVQVKFHIQLELQGNQGRQSASDHNAKCKRPCYSREQVTMGSASACSFLVQGARVGGGLNVLKQQMPKGMMMEDKTWQREPWLPPHEKQHSCSWAPKPDLILNM